VSIYGEFYPPASDDNCNVETNVVPTASGNQLSDLTNSWFSNIWRGSRFHDGADTTGDNFTHRVVSGGASGVHTTGIGSNFVNIGVPPSDPYIGGSPYLILRETYLRFDTSSLDDDLEITGVKLGLYVTAVGNTYGSGMTSNPSLRIFAGLGSGDRPTFSSPVNISNDNAWDCDNAGGCSSYSASTCDGNSGATDVCTVLQSDLSSGSRNEITLTDGTNAQSGSATTYDDWINKTGYTYIYVGHSLWVDSNRKCQNFYDPTAPSGEEGATFPTLTEYTYGVETCAVSFNGGTSGNGPYLAINQGKTKFQMII
jgi:hypothetical protein